MLHPRLLLAAIAIVALPISMGEAGNGISLGGQGLRVDMRPRDPGAISDGTVSRADCRVRVNQREAVLHWTATPFTHLDHPEFQSDTWIVADVTDQLGMVSVSPRRTRDRTKIDRGDDGAAIAMGIAGNGQVKIRLDVGIDNPNAIAGRHCATVVLTVTGH